MIGTRPRVAAIVAAMAGASLVACATRGSVPSPAPHVAPAPAGSLHTAIEARLASPALAGAAVAIHIESLDDHRVIYSHAADARMMPASVLKLVTAAVAADRLGWTHSFDTRLEAAGPIVDGVLRGDLIVIGSGDPTIDAQDLRTAPLFDEWADALRAAGITRVDGRLIGDDSAFADERLGAGWAWDYLTAAYAAPSGALSYNGNLVAVQIAPAADVGAPALVTLQPPGHGLALHNVVVTAAPGTTPTIAIERWPGSHTLTVRGQVPHGSAPQVRATTVANPTDFFVDGLRLALAARGIRVRDGAVDIDDLTSPPTPGPRREIARRSSVPLSSLVAQMLKTSQNFYAEMLIKAIGRTAADSGGVGSTERGRQLIRQTLERWGIGTDALVMYDVSGLSRYDYVSARLLTDVLKTMWQDDRYRGSFAAALPVAGHDGTLGARMTDTLRRRVQAKTGTIANVRSLAGYMETAAGERLVFAMLANHFVAPNADVDRIMEGILGEVDLAGTTGTTGERWGP